MKDVLEDNKMLNVRQAEILNFSFVSKEIFAFFNSALLQNPNQF